jgi:hypothetical protein
VQIEASSWKQRRQRCRSRHNLSRSSREALGEFSERQNRETANMIRRGVASNPRFAQEIASVKSAATASRSAAPVSPSTPVGRSIAKNAHSRQSAAD